MSRGFTTEAHAETSLLCTANGCVRRWTCDFGKRLCSEHDRILRFADAAAVAQKQIPETLRPATPHWQDTKDDDDAPLPF